MQVGDTLKQADGTTGIVTDIQTLGESRQMYNLSVGVAHTYFVGDMGWLVHNAKVPTDPNRKPYATYNGLFTTGGKGPSLPKVIADIRADKDVQVTSAAQARQILGAVGELRPYTKDRLLPNPDKGSGQGFDMPRGTFKGDLANKQDPSSKVVNEDIDNKVHAERPHYNIKLPNGMEPSIIIDCDEWGW